MIGWPVASALNKRRFAVLTLLWCLTYLQVIATRPIRLYDESTYANVGRHALRDGDWLIPHMYFAPGNYEVWFAKPPLVPWMEAVGMWLFGVNRFGFRLPIAVSALVLGFVLYVIGRQLYDENVGYASALLGLFSPVMFGPGHSGTSGTADGVLVLFGTIFVFLVWQYDGDRSQMLAAGAAAGLAFMAKGIGAGVFLFVLAPVLLYNYRTYVDKNVVLGAGVASLVSVPWVAYAWLSRGNFVFEQLLFKQLARSSGEFGGTTGALLPTSNYPYFRLLVTSEHYLLLTGLSLLGLAAAVRSGEPKRFLAWWALAPALFFSLVGGNHGWYLLPMIVPASILGGIFCTRVWTVVTNHVRVPRSESVYTLLGVSGAVLLVLVVQLTTPVVASPQQQLGETADATVPDDETIHIVGPVSGKLWVFQFVAQNPMEKSGYERVAVSDEITYVLVESGNRDNIDAPVKVLGETDRLVLARVERDEDVRDTRPSLGV
jgi:4-amino-4-deoxy-L-arabinose transferase-like glycosyltransferase